MKEAPRNSSSTPPTTRKPSASSMTKPVSTPCSTAQAIPTAIEPDVYDEIRGLDRLEDGAFVMLVDEHRLKNQMPYSFEARDFAAKVAALGEEGAYDDAIETLDAVIAEARALCGIELSTS